MPGIWRRPPQPHQRRPWIEPEAPVVGDYVTEVLADSPAGYWRLGEASGNPQDSSGNARHMTVVAGTPTYDVAGAIVSDDDGAVTFDGSTEYFTTPDGAWFDFGDVFTLEAWVECSASGAMTIVSKGTNSFQLRIVTPGDDGTARALELVRTGVAEIVESTADVPSSGWHHVVATKTGATVKLYIDGSDVTGTVSNSTFTDNANALAVGATPSPAEFFNGSIDEVAVYLTALSAGRVLVHYQAGIASGGPINVTATDSLTIGNTVARQLTLARAVADSVTYGNTVARVVTNLRTAADALGFGDAVTRVVTLTRTAADSLTAGNTVARVFTGARTLADSLSVGDAVTRTGTFLRSVADSLNIADVVTGIRVIARTVADSLNIADAVARTGTFLRTTTDSLSIGNTVARVGTFLRTAADSLSFSDVVEAIKSGVIVRTVTDALNIGDTVSRTGTFLRTAADSLTMGNVVEGLRLIVRSVADSLSIGNTVTRTVTLARTVADSLTIGNTVSRVLSLARTAADALATATSVTAEKLGGVAGGLGPRIASAIASIPGIGSAIAPRPGGSATSSKPDGSADHSKPEH